VRVCRQKIRGFGEIQEDSRLLNFVRAMLTDRPAARTNGGDKEALFGGFYKNVWVGPAGALVSERSGAGVLDPSRDEVIQNIVHSDLNTELVVRTVCSGRFSLLQNEEKGTTWMDSLPRLPTKDWDILNLY
jgi:hypothetical protein